MRISEEDMIYAPYMVLDARRILASVRKFSARVHADAYSIPSVAIELGVPVEYLRDRSREMIGACFRADQGLVIRLNEDVEGTLYDMPSLIHELGHAVVQEISLRCRGEASQKRERDAWLRGIYVAISHQLAAAIEHDDLTVRQVAGRCCVPEPIIRARVALGVILREIGGDLIEAHDELAEQLYLLDAWFDDGRRDGFSEPIEA